MEGQNRMIFGQHCVDGVAQFVGQSGYIADFAGVVEQHKGGYIRHGTHTKRAAAFARPHFRINMPFLKHATRQRACLRRKLIEGFQRHLRGGGVVNLLF